MSDVPQVGVDVSGQVIVLDDLHAQIEAQSIPLPYGLTLHGPDRPFDPTHIPPPSQPTDPQPAGTMLYTHDAQGNPIDLPPGAEAIVRSYTYTAS